MASLVNMKTRKCIDCDKRKAENEFQSSKHFICTDCELSIQSMLDTEDEQARAAKTVAEPVRLVRNRILPRIYRGTNDSVETLLGYSFQELAKSLESKFTDGMCWRAFATGEIHIDHIVPLACLGDFEVTDPLFRCAWSLENLQPMWADENFRKSATLPRVLPDWFFDFFRRAGDHSSTTTTNHMPTG